MATPAPRSSLTTRVAAATAALFLAVLAGAPSAAMAGFVGQSITGAVTITAAAGEDNELRVGVTAVGGTTVTVEELNAPTLTTSSTGCTQLNPRKVACHDDSLHSRIDIALGDMNDGLFVSGDFPLAVNVTGGTGNDNLDLFDVGSVEADGGDGSDVIQTGDSADFLEGGDGDDVVNGRLGSDVLNGGAGTDTASYTQHDGVAVTVGSGVNDGAPGERDYVAGDFERVMGSSGDDTLVGDGAANVLHGRDGGDVLRGGGGDDLLDGDGDGTTNPDVFDGGPGMDTADYSLRGFDMDITIGDGPNDGANLGGESEGDDVQATVENVVGGFGVDVITGSDSPNRLLGGPGDDFLDGAGGNDTLDGGVGADHMFGGDDSDTVTYAGRSASVFVSVGSGVNDGGTGERDYVGSETENVVGGNGGDTLTGNAQVNRLDGGAGNDTLDGRGGPDVMIGGAGTGDTVTYASRTVNVIADLDAAVGDDGEDTDGNFSANEGDTIAAGVENLTGGAGDDRLDGNALVNALRGGAGDDRLVGGDGDDVFEGGTGGDLSSGGGGIDTTTYAGRAESVTVLMNALADDGGASDETGDGGTPDDQVGTENVIGGGRADTLTGDALANTITGGPGADTLRGLGNADRLRAKDGGADTVVNCGAGTDVAEADGSDPVVTVGVDACESVI